MRCSGLISLVALLALFGVGCKEPGVAQKAEQTPFLALSGAPSAVLSLNVERLRLLSIFEAARDAILKDEARSKWWKSLREKTGLDPLIDIDRVVVGIQGTWNYQDPLDGAVVVFTGRFADPQKIADGFRAFLAEHYLADPPPFNKADREGIAVYSTKAPLYRNTDKLLEFHLAFPSPSLMVLCRSGPKMDETVGVLQGKIPGIQKDPTWQKRLGAVDLGAMVWAVGEFPSSVNQYLGEHIKKEPELKNLNALTTAQSFYANLSVDREYVFRGGLVCENIERAKALAGDLKSARKILPRLLGHFFGAGSPKIDYAQEILDAVFISNEFNTASLAHRMDRRAVEEFVRKMTSPVATPTPREIPAPFLQPTPR